MAEEKGDGLEFANPDDMLAYSKDLTFSHQYLVMRVYQKAQDALAIEMVRGFWDFKYDRVGNPIKVYFPDTRRAAIEAIKTLKNTMIADLKGSSEHKKAIDELEKKEKGLFQEKLTKQKTWFISLGMEGQQRYRGEHIGFNFETLSEQSNFYDDYVENLLNVYREIFEQLELCLAERKYFKRQQGGR